MGVLYNTVKQQMIQAQQQQKWIDSLQDLGVYYIDNEDLHKCSVEELKSKLVVELIKRGIE